MPQQKPLALMVTDLQNGEGEPIASANHAVMDCSFLCEAEVPAGAFVRKRIAEQ